MARVRGQADSRWRQHQTDRHYDPVGLFGLLYWYALYPLHAIVFHGMLSGIVREATASADS
jgi:hypothetical protein